MPINLHRGCSQRLRELLREVLSNILVTNDTFLGPGSYSEFLSLENVLPETGSIRQDLEKYISDSPISDFLFGFISRELFEENAYVAEDREKELSELSKYSNIDSTANRLIDQFNSLPLLYTFTFEFDSGYGKEIAQAVGNYKISDNIHIITPNEQHIRNYPLISGIKNRDDYLFKSGILSGLPSILGNQHNKWKTDNAYLQIILDGFVERFMTTNTLFSAIFQLKAFFGLSIAVGLLNIKHLANNYLQWLVVHIMQGEKGEILETHKLSDKISYGLSNLDLNIKKEYRNSSNLEPFIRTLFHKISLAFNHKNRQDKMLLAANWYFDARTSKDELLGFIQAMVVLEILLGDKSMSDILGLSELLRNRCAYLVSKNFEERSEILEKFKELYKVRSHIVHGGKNQLNREEREAFYYLLSICARVIEQELKILSE